MSAAFFDEWGHPVTETDVCGPEDDPNYVPEPQLPAYFDSEDPWCHWMIAELIIACSDADQSSAAPW